MKDNIRDKRDEGNVHTIEDLTAAADQKTLDLLVENAGLQVRNTAERIGVKHMGPETIAAFRAALELHHQAPHDLMGAQRDFMLPRILLLARFFMERFPHQMLEAMTGAVDGYGDKINGDD